MKRVLLGLIRFYRRYISSLFRPCCRFTPTCSRYALEAVERFGACRGAILALWRVLRCNPLNPGGYDPVPDTFTLRSYSRRTGGHSSTDCSFSDSSGDLSDPSDHPPAG